MTSDNKLFTRRSVIVYVLGIVAAIVAGIVVYVLTTGYPRPLFYSQSIPKAPDDDPKFGKFAVSAVPGASDCDEWSVNGDELELTTSHAARCKTYVFRTFDLPHPIRHLTASFDELTVSSEANDPKGDEFPERSVLFLLAYVGEPPWEEMRSHDSFDLPIGLGDQRWGHSFNQKGNATDIQLNKMSYAIDLGSEASRITFFVALRDGWNNTTFTTRIKNLALRESAPP